VDRIEVAHFQDDKALADFAVEKWFCLIEAAFHQGRAHCVALSGGRIAQQFFVRAAQQSRDSSLPLHHVHFFWADERCVPPTDRESNFFLAWHGLLQPFGIPLEQIHRILGEEDPSVAVAKAEAEMAKVVRNKSGRIPVLDLILLGMGEDGHVASLFPGSVAEATSDDSIYRAVVGPKPPPKRITLTYRAIGVAHEVWVLISGLGKEAALNNSLQPDGTTPLARVCQARGRTLILTDLHDK
jgi:6-phosphogluconolactonase